MCSYMRVVIRCNGLGALGVHSELIRNQNFRPQPDEVQTQYLLPAPFMFLPVVVIIGANQRISRRVTLIRMLLSAAAVVLVMNLVALSA